MAKSQPRKRVTIHDVAERAGVSYQTVSRVINNHPRVAPATRARVIQAIEDMNYYPSNAARDLAAHRSRTIGVITYSLKYYGPTQMLVNIEQSAKAAGYDLIFSNVDPLRESSIDAAVELIRRWSVAGVLIIAPVFSPQYERLLEQFNGIPCVQIDIQRGANVASVIVDQYHGSQVATNHLLELAHTEIATIKGPENWFGAEARYQGFVDALSHAGLEPVGVETGDWTASSGYNAIDALLHTQSFTALVVANDQMALGAIHALTKHGVSVPGDVSVVGFDDIPEAAFFTPALTTVRQNFSLLGQQGLHYLNQLIQDEAVEQPQWVIKPDLIVRESTAHAHFPHNHDQLVDNL